MKDWRKQQRSRLLQQRATLAADERSRIQHSVISHLRQLLQHQTPATLGIYWPIKGELDCRGLAKELIDSGWTVAVPVINNKTKMLDFSHWQPDMPMVQGTWNIPVPAHQHLLVPDMFLIPLLGFDSDNYRLGYGGGYYDRTLAEQAHSVTIIGVGIEQGRFETIFPQPHDIAMNMIVTEAGIQKN